MCGICGAIDFKEGGNAAAEAIACGTPVLVTDECGIAPLVNERAGLAVACSIEGLRDGLLRLLVEESLLSRLADGCESLAGELSWDGPVEEMELIYASLENCEIRIADCGFKNADLESGASDLHSAIRNPKSEI